MWPAASYRSEECTLVAPARLFLFSDGVYEIHQPDGEQLEFAAFVERLTRGGSDGTSDLDELLRFARDMHGAEVLEDDFSIVRMTI
jgi:sigma-B regulation protein RsbU (phosphoserine phosphatase)